MRRAVHWGPAVATDLPDFPLPDNAAPDTTSETTVLQRAKARLEFEMELSGPLVPAAQVPQPATQVPQPAARVGKPTDNVTEPAAPVSKPAARVGKPVPTDSDAISEAYAPYERLTAQIPDDSPLHAMQSLDEVESYVANTVLIPLDETRLNPVFGVGNPAADLLVIGEAPGADEDKKGEPFVGRAGQLLDKILLAIGFERSDVYIANILKSRPPNNRNPSIDEVAAHLPILLKQILLIQPKLILCVGRTAGTSLLGIESSLSAMRGKFHDYHGVPVLVTYHPAALLRNPNWKPATWEDVKSLRARYDELTGHTQ